jgi:hypothetical protein
VREARRARGPGLGAAVAVCAALLATAPPVRAEARVELRAETDGGLVLTATNAGDAPASDLVPELVYHHRRETGEPVTLAPGEQHVWRLELVPESGAGALPAIVRARWTDTGGHGRETPLVLAVPGDAGGDVSVDLDASPVARLGHVSVALSNPGRDPVTGRVALVLPGGLVTEPESLPARIEPETHATVPIVLQNDGSLPPGRYPIFAALEYDEGGVHRTAIGRATVEVVVPTGGHVPPLLVGTLSLLAALLALALAWRASR